MSLTMKVTIVPKSKNTKKNIYTFKCLIVYSLAISFDWQPENMQIRFCSFFGFCQKFKKRKMVMADFFSCSESSTTDPKSVPTGTLGFAGTLNICKYCDKCAFKQVIPRMVRGKSK